MPASLDAPRRAHPSVPGRAHPPVPGRAHTVVPGTVVAVAVAVAVVAVAVLGGAPRAGAVAVCYRHPVAAPVVRDFAAPPCPWCAGHRGLEYATAPGTPVGPAAPGTVAFAGPVAGRRWVTVTHADGRRTSYGPLRTVAVRRGTRVDADDVLGRTAGRLHVGLRRGDTYLDPALHFAAPLRRVSRLVPLTGPVPPRPAPACTPGRARGGVR